MKNVIQTIAAGIAFAALASPAQADVSPLINYQGYIEIDGSPVANTTPTNYRIEFYVYDQPTGGTVLWGEVQTVTVYRGVFNTLLGAGDPVGLDENELPDPPRPPLVDVFADGERWLTFVVPALDSGELGVRQQVASTPQALVAQRVVDNTIASNHVLDRSIAGVDRIEGTVSSLEIADNTITFHDLAIGSVGSAEIIDFTIGAVDMADGAVDSRILADNSVGSADISDFTIGAADLADGAVDGRIILDRTITHSDIAFETIGGAEIIDRSIGGIDMIEGTVGSFEIQDNSITTFDIEDGTVNTFDILDGTVGAADIQDGSVGHRDLAEKLGGTEFGVYSRVNETGGWGSVHDWHLVTNGSGIITNVLIMTDNNYSDRTIEQQANNPVPGFYIRIDGQHVYGPFANYIINNATSTAVNGGGIPLLTGHHGSGMEHVLSFSPFLRFNSLVEIRQSASGALRAGIQLTYQRNP